MTSKLSLSSQGIFLVTLFEFITSLTFRKYYISYVNLVKAQPPPPLALARKTQCGLPLKGK